MQSNKKLYAPPLQKSYAYKIRFMGLLIVTFLLGCLMSACGSQPLSNTSQSTALTSTPTPAIDTSNWQAYTSPEFTLRYPPHWIASIVPPGPLKGLYIQDIEFRPSPTSNIQFSVRPMYNGEMSPDTQLYDDQLLKESKIESKDKVTINGLTWSTATFIIQGGQLVPGKGLVAYANHIHPYNVTYMTPPDQFDTNYDTLNAIFHTFQEKQ